jgi:DNA-binding NarL/FixJ family response regulator
MTKKVELGKRELEIVELIAAGLTRKEVAARMSISAITVRNSLVNIFCKTGAQNSIQLVIIAIQRGWITIPGVEVKDTDPTVL